MSENEKVHINSVKEVTDLIQCTLEDSPLLRNITVRGELSSVTKSKTQYKTDCYYFTLTENNVNLPGVMFTGVDRMNFDPKKGDMVVCVGSATIYAPHEKYQLKCVSMKRDGEGDEATAFEELREKLRKEGLFSQRRPFPKFPKKIAVVTSGTGLVQEDIYGALQRRYPMVKVCLIHANVQGGNAEASLCAGIRKAQTVGADLIIFGRGGGSETDLKCFNSEALAREIFASKIPTVSAVGHRLNHPLCEDVADKTAGTPTEAAELVTPDIANIIADIGRMEQELRSAAARKISDCERALEVAERDVRLASPKERLTRGESELERLTMVIKTAMTAKLDRAGAELRAEMQRIVDTNPTTVLSRGYSIVSAGGKIITSAEELSEGDEIGIRLGKGSVTARITLVNGD